jgi:hypothetical protein
MDQSCQEGTASTIYRLALRRRLQVSKETLDAQLETPEESDTHENVAAYMNHLAI